MSKAIRSVDAPQFMPPNVISERSLTPNEHLYLKRYQWVRLLQWHALLWAVIVTFCIMLVMFMPAFFALQANLLLGIILLFITLGVYALIIYGSRRKLKSYFSMRPMLKVSENARVYTINAHLEALEIIGDGHTFAMTGDVCFRIGDYYTIFPRAWLKYYDPIPNHQMDVVVFEQSRNEPVVLVGDVRPYGNNPSSRMIQSFVDAPLYVLRYGELSVDEDVSERRVLVTNERSFATQGIVYWIYAGILGFFAYLVWSIFEPSGTSNESGINPIYWMTLAGLSGMGFLIGLVLIYIYQPSRRKRPA